MLTHAGKYLTSSAVSMASIEAMTAGTRRWMEPTANFRIECTHHTHVPEVATKKADLESGDDHSNRPRPFFHTTRFRRHVLQHGVYVRIYCVKLNRLDKDLPLGGTLEPGLNAFLNRFQNQTFLDQNCDF